MGLIVSLNAQLLGDRGQKDSEANVTDSLLWLMY